MDDKPNRQWRVSLTRRDLSTVTGAALLEKLEQIVTDGLIAEGELASLAAWLDEAACASDIPGIHFLREEVSGILADGSVSDPESRLLRNAILRVLPVTERERARARFGEAAARVRDTRQKESLAAADLATARQVEYIQALGGTCPEGTSKQQASTLIDGLLATRPTVRQRMVLRFWNRLDLLESGVDGVSTWLDKWYAEDADRIEAWALWKRESGDEGGRLSEYVDRVPLGAGAEYLVRVKARLSETSEVRPTRATVNRHESVERGSTWGKVGVIGLGLLAFLLVTIILLR